MSAESNPLAWAVRPWVFMREGYGSSHRFVMSGVVDSRPFLLSKLRPDSPEAIPPLRYSRSGAFRPGCVIPSGGDNLLVREDIVQELGDLPGCLWLRCQRGKIVNLEMPDAGDESIYERFMDLVEHREQRVCDFYPDWEPPDSEMPGYFEGVSFDYGDHIEDRHDLSDEPFWGFEFAPVPNPREDRDPTGFRFSALLMEQYTMFRFGSVVVVRPDLMEVLRPHIDPVFYGIAPVVPVPDRKGELFYFDPE